MPDVQEGRRRAMSETVASFKRAYTSGEIASVKNQLDAAARRFGSASRWTKFFQDHRKWEAALATEIIRANLIYRDGEMASDDKTLLREALSSAEAALGMPKNHV
jgi:hypothetical protein